MTYSYFVQISEYEDADPKDSFAPLMKKPEHIRSIQKDLRKDARFYETLFLQQVLDELKPLHLKRLPTACKMLFVSENDGTEWVGFSFFGPYVRWTAQMREIVDDYMEAQVTDGWGEDLLLVKCPGFAYSVG